MDQAALVEPFSIGLYAQRLAGDVSGKIVPITNYYRLNSTEQWVYYEQTIHVATAHIVYMTVSRPLVSNDNVAIQAIELCLTSSVFIRAVLNMNRVDAFRKKWTAIVENK